MKILSIDVGSGDIKYLYSVDGNFTDRGKEINAVAKLPADAIIQPDQSDALVELNGQKYLVGAPAVHTRKSIQFHTDSFNDIKNLSPIVIQKFINKYKEYDFIVIDISLAYYKQAEELVSHITRTLGIDSSKVTIVPQGIGCKLAYQWKGTNPNGNAENIIGSYMAFDIGFNTIDTFQCVNGKLTSDGVTGKEQTGIVAITNKLIDFCSSVGDIPMAMAKEGIITKQIVFHGKPIQGIAEKVDSLVKEYVENLYKLLTSEYKELIDVSQGVIFFGGGSALIREELLKQSPYAEGFIKVPEEPEYYNAIGNIYYVLKREYVL